MLPGQPREQEVEQRAQWFGGVIGTLKQLYSAFARTGQGLIGEALAEALMEVCNLPHRPLDSGS